MIIHKYTAHSRVLGVLAALVMIALPVWADDTGNTVRGAGDAWHEQTRLLSPAGGITGSRFGLSVDIYGDYALVGSPGRQSFPFTPGEAYVFKRENGVWREQAKLTPSDSHHGDFFGIGVALSEDVAMVTAGTTATGAPPGRVYIFSRDGENWNEQQTLTGSGGGPGDMFGSSISIDGDTVLIGAPIETVDANPWQGAAYVFQRIDGLWEEQARLLDDDAGVGEIFYGGAVALNGDTALITSPYETVDGNAGQGSVHVFVQENDNWELRTKLVLPDGSAEDWFGTSLALQNDIALIGAPAALGSGRMGAAYIFERSGDNWSQPFELLSSLGTTVGETYGERVLLLDDIAVVSEPQANVDDIKQGAVHVFRANGGVWSQEALLNASDGTPTHSFGGTMAITEGELLVGAQGAMVHNVSQGAAYFFADIEPSPDNAMLEGVVQGLGHCDADVLPLENARIEVTGTSGTYAEVSRYDGYYRLNLDAGESPVDITVTAAGHLPVTLEGVTFGSGDVLVEDFDLRLEQACASVTPDSASVQLDPGQSTTEMLTIENIDGGAPLAWSIMDSSPIQFTGDGVDCEPGPGVIVHDSGKVGQMILNDPSGESVAYVDRFAPQAYPATLGEVCISVARWNADDDPQFEFELVVFDDDGENGAPGTELGVLHATADDIPVWPLTRPLWAKFDISSLGILIEEGGVYIGMRWSPSIRIVVPVDVFPDNRPAGYAGGYRWQAGVDWSPIEGDYRSLIVRATTDPRGCLDPSAVPWLSVDLDSGTTPAGAADAIQVTLDSSGLDPGVYPASLCITTDDPLRPLLVVPVELGVTGPPGPGVLAAEPGVVDFGEVTAGSSQIDSFVVTNATAPGADNIEIASFELAAGAPEFQLAGGSCEIGTVLPPGAKCRIRVTLQPGDVSNTMFDGAVVVETVGGQSISVSLAGEVPPNPPSISVAPGSLSSVLAHGQSESQSLTVTNLGDEALDWAITEDGALGGQVLRPGSTVTRYKTREASQSTGHWTVPADLDVAPQPFHVREEQVTLTHSTSMDIEVGAPSCSNTSDGTTASNSHLRTFTLEDFGIDGPLEVSEVTFGIAQLTDAIPVTVNLYMLDGEFTYDNMTLIGSVSEGMEPVDVQNPVLVTLPVAARVPPGSTLVVEIVGPDMTGVGVFFPAANSLGESAPSYIVSADCAINDPAPYSSIGFADTHLVMSVTGTAEPLDCTLPDWAQADPRDGTVAGGDGQPVELTFDASARPPGQYYGTLCLSSNDPGRLLTTIPLELTVEEAQAGPGELVAQPPELDFGEVVTGGSASAGVTVTNAAGAGAQAVSIGSVELLSGAPAFELIGDDCQGAGLAPGESCSVEVRFEPSSEQLYSGVVRVRGGDGQEVVVGLSGTGTVAGEAIFSDRFEQP